MNGLLRKWKLTNESFPRDSKLARFEYYGDPNPPKAPLVEMDLDSVKSTSANYLPRYFFHRVIRIKVHMTEYSQTMKIGMRSRSIGLQKLSIVMEYRITQSDMLQP